MDVAVKVRACWRWGFAILIGSVALGCGAIDPRVAMVRSQAATWKQVHQILVDVTDAPSMEQAKGKLQKSFGHFQRLAEEAQSLDHAVAPEIAEQMRLEAQDLTKAMNDTIKEMGRIRRLPDGQHFIDQFKTMLPSN